MRVNDRIRALTVRLISDEDDQVGIVSIEKAREMAREQSSIWWELLPMQLHRSADHGLWKVLYRQNKQEQKQKKSQKQGEVKGIRLSMRTDTHDLEVKANKAKDFLKDRSVVKVAMILRGREVTYGPRSRKMKLFVSMIAEEGEVEDRPKETGEQHHRHDHSKITEAASGGLPLSIK